MDDNSTGRRVHIGVGLQSAKGTPATDITWLARTSTDFDQQVGTMMDESAIGSLDLVSDSEVMETYSEGNLCEMYVRPDSIGLLLLGFYNTVLVNGNASPYSHVYSNFASNEDNLFTIVLQDKNTAKVFQDCRLKGLEFAIDKGSWLKVTPSFCGPSSTNAPSLYTPVYSNFAGRFRAKTAELRMAETVTDSRTGDISNFSSLKFSLMNSVERYHASGSDDPNQIYNTQRNISGDTTLLYSNDDHRDAWVDQGHRFMSIKFVADRSTLADGSTNPSLTFEIGNYKGSVWSVNRDNDTILEQTIGFQSLSIGSTLGNATLVNDQSSY